MKNIVISILLLTIAHVSMAQLYINEISATNADQVYDTKFYNFSSWVELYNAGDAAVDLHNYYFSDDPSNPQKWQFPNDAIIESKSYLIVWCDDQNQDLHTNFNLDKDGEDLILSDADGIEVDHIIYPPQFTNVSFGRFSNGNATMAYQLKATPGEANVGSNATQRLGKVVFNTEAGKYASQQSITLSHPTAGVTIRYTTDGSEPNETSTSYSAAIVLTKTSIVKAKAFHPDFIAGQTQANTYFINERDFSLPVVSLSIAPNYLNDDMIGIYVAGTNGIPGRGTDIPVNWNQDWSRHADFEYFSPAGKRQFDQAVDVRIYGNYSRTRPQKSFAIKARNKYEDNEMKFKFFPNKTQDEYGAMVLRNSGTDWNITHFRDALMQRITIGEMDLDYLDYQPTILFLNGEYWGIQNLREKYDADYFKSNYDIDVEELDLMESNNAVLEGDAEFYKDYRDNLGDMDRTDPAAINYIENNIDVQNFINYQVHNIYIGNGDWPGNNVKYWRHRTPQGRFRWLLYDCDGGFGDNPQFASLEWATSPNSTIPHNRPSSTLHFRHLLENPVFKRRFISTMTTALQTTYQPERILALIDQMQSNIQTEMPFHRQKWGGSVNNWKSKVEIFRTFAVNRNPFMVQHMIDFFGLENETKITVKVTPEDAGEYELNGVTVSKSLENAFYFYGLPFKVSATANKGYKFKHWIVNKRNSATIDVIALESTWKYYDGGNIGVSDWNSPMFDDSAWKTGSGQFGYGEGDEKTVVNYGPTTSNRYTTTYFRKEINITKASDLENISGSVLFDDGVVLYLNGNEIFRHSMPTGAIEYSTLASRGNENAVASFSIDKSMFVDGKNVISAEVHQSSISSTDLSFDLQMNITQIGDFEETISEEQRIESTVYSDATLEAVFEPFNTVTINEFSASNKVVKDEFGDKDDWIELYNGSTTDIDVGGYYITDDLSNKTKYQIPTGSAKTIVPAGGYLLLWADGQVNQGANHVDLKLSADGESLGLYKEDDEELLMIDEFSFTIQSDLESWARIPNGTGPFVLSENPTPGKENAVITGVEEETDDAFDAYPNPTDGQLELTFMNAINDVQLFDLYGRSVKNVGRVGSKVTLNVSDLTKGVYIIRVRSGNMSAYKRVVRR